MVLKEKTKNFLIRLSIAAIVLIIAGIYYLSELRPFPYEGYEKDINQLQRFDAELNEAIVLTRFGLLTNYDPIVQALNGSQQMVYDFKKTIAKHPNRSIEEKINKLEATVKKKAELTQKFERINPVLINAIYSFSKILSQIIESESNTQLV